jgi:hypothetical protein
MLEKNNPPPLDKEYKKGEDQKGENVKEQG